MIKTALYFTISLLIILFTACGRSPYVRVNIIGYPKLKSFTIKVAPESSISLNGSRTEATQLTILPPDKLLIDRGSSVYIIEELLIESEEQILFASIHGEQSYSGSFRIFPAEGELQVINRVSREHYFASVLGSEMGGSFSEETLKAQAIAVRTYYYRRKALYSNGDFDINNADGRDMVYRGAAFATERMRRIMEETEGLYLLERDGSLALPLFHSTSGGVILKDEVMSSKRGEADQSSVVLIDSDERGRAYGADSPYYSFTARVGDKDMLKIARAMTGLKELKGVKLDYIEGTDCVDFIGFIDGNDVTHWVKGYRFLSQAQRRGLHGLRSIQFKLSRFPGYYRFTGEGFGHLCGMSQYSAEALAREGAGWQELLGRYYPEYRVKLIHPLFLPFYLKAEDS